jgi:hypothetical protein
MADGHARSSWLLLKQSFLKQADTQTTTRHFCLNSIIRKIAPFLGTDPQNGSNRMALRGPFSAVCSVTDFEFNGNVANTGGFK